MCEPLLSTLVKKTKERNDIGTNLQTDINVFKQILLPFGHSINELRNVKYGNNCVWYSIIDGLIDVD